MINQLLIACRIALRTCLSHCGNIFALLLPSTADKDKKRDTGGLPHSLFAHLGNLKIR
jgi:hypothetical protein